MNRTEDQGKLDPDLVGRLQRALRAGPEDLYQVMQDPSMEVLRAAFKNPALSEEHLLVLLKRRDLTEEIPRTIYRQQRIELSHRLLVALVQNPATPAPVSLTLLPRLHLFELVALLFLPWATPDQKLGAERQIVKRLPTVPLGNKITLARRGSSIVVEALLKEGEPRAVAACLDNPRLREVSILQFLASSGATAETISMVARHERWKSRPHLRLAILRNQKTPPVWYTLWLPSIPLRELHNLQVDRRLSARQKKMVVEEVKRREKRG